MMDFHHDICIIQSIHQPFIHQRNINSDLLGIIDAVAQGHTGSRCQPTWSCNRIVLADLSMQSALPSFICIYSTNSHAKNSSESLFSRVTDLRTQHHAA